VEIKGPLFFRLGPGIVCMDPGSQDRLTSGAIFNRNLMGFYVNLRYNLGARWISTKIKNPSTLVDSLNGGAEWENT